MITDSINEGIWHLFKGIFKKPQWDLETPAWQILTQWDWISWERYLGYHCNLLELINCKLVHN